jgi:hypothetical protein
VCHQTWSQAVGGTATVAAYIDISAFEVPPVCCVLLVPVLVQGLCLSVVVGCLWHPAMHNSAYAACSIAAAARAQRYHFQ